MPIESQDRQRPILTDIPRIYGVEVMPTLGFWPAEVAARKARESPVGLAAARARPDKMPQTIELIAVDWTCSWGKI
jgi:hypothetical protein